MAAFVGALLVVLIWRFLLLLGATVFEAGGLPHDAARFQAASALTGSGFTTAESDLVVRNPAARRIAQILFVLGYIGPASVLALFGVGVFLPEAESGAAKLVTAAIVLALVTLSIKAKPAVRAQMSLARWVGRRIVAGEQPLVWFVAPDVAVASAFLADGHAAVGRQVGDWTPPGIEVLGIGSLDDGSERWESRPPETRMLRAHDRILVFGDATAIRSMAPDGGAS